MNADDQRLLDWAELSLAGKDHVATVWRWRTNLNELLAVHGYEVLDGVFRERFDAIVFITDDRLFPRVCWTEMFKHFRPCALLAYDEPNAYQIACTKLHDTVIQYEHIETIGTREGAGLFICQQCGESLTGVIQKLYAAIQKTKA